MKPGDIFWRPSAGVDSPVWLFCSDTETKLLKSSTNMPVPGIRTIYGSKPADKYQDEEGIQIICNIADVDSWREILVRQLEKGTK